jgi:CubicO group peptidase (beta-lactamase class C family)
MPSEHINSMDMLASLLAPSPRTRIGGDPYRDYSEEEFRDALATVELTFDPGTKHGYSNFAVGLLGFVLATQNGSDYETLVPSKICQPPEWTER